MSERMPPAVEVEALPAASSASARGGLEERVVRHGDRVWSARHVLLRRLLACADLLAGLCASAALTALDGGSASLAWALVCLPSWIVVAKVLGLYDEDERSLRHLTVDELPRLVVWALAGVAALSLALELTPAGRPDASQAVAAGFVALGAVISLRALSRLLWRRVVPPERVALVGAADRVAAVRRKLELLPGVHVDVVVELEAGDLEAIVRSLGDVDRVVLAPATLDDPEVPRLVPLLRRAQTTLTVVPPSSWPLTPAVRLRHLAELPLLEYGKQDLSRSTLLLKRLLDVGVSVAALAFLLPLFALIAVAIALDSRGPVIFSQQRAGAHGRPFRMLKFRSMIANAEELLPNLVSIDRLEEPVFKLEDDPRVTRVGRLLRRWSLDELPQLWNVLTGDMSLVGPRPEELAIVERYTPEQRIRLTVKPGLTGPMQVFGRGALTFEERLAVERAYIESLSLGRDLRILGLTLSAVVRGSGAY